MDEMELEKALERMAQLREQPPPALLAKAKARLRRSRRMPWLLAASFASQVASVIGGYWLIVVFPAGWLFKILWLSGLASAIALPLVLLALHWPEHDRVPQGA